MGRSNGGSNPNNRVQQIHVEIAELKEKLDRIHGTPCEIYSRVVGYHRPVQNWNKGKQEEFKDRVTFKV